MCESLGDSQKICKRKEHCVTGTTDKEALRNNASSAQVGLLSHNHPSLSLSFIDTLPRIIVLWPIPFQRQRYFAD